jgi:hypothetical protein
MIRVNTKRAERRQRSIAVSPVLLYDFRDLRDQIEVVIY